MRLAGLALFILAGCSDPAHKRLPGPPLPADIVMRSGGSYEAVELTFRAYKVAWMRERSNARTLIGVIEHPGRRHLWTVVGFRQRSRREALAITVINGNIGVFEPEVEVLQFGACPDIDLPLPINGFSNLHANGGKKWMTEEKTSVIPDPQYVLITQGGEYHFRRTQDPNTAAQIDSLLAALDDCRTSAG